jgi:hypothetical protein
MTGPAADRRPRTVKRCDAWRPGRGRSSPVGRLHGCHRDGGPIDRPTTVHIACWGQHISRERGQAPVATAFTDTP